MGYTHYWENFQPLSNEGVEAIESLLKDHTNLVQREMNENGPAVVTSDEILFNGIGADAYETFHVAGSGWDYCKTYRRPYDVVVVAVLTLLEYFIEGFTWSSDGDHEDLKEGKALANKYIS